MHAISSAALPRPQISLLLVAVVVTLLGIPAGAAAAEAPIPRLQAAGAPPARALPDDRAGSLNGMSDAEVARVLSRRASARRAPEHTSRAGRDDAPAVPPAPEPAPQPVAEPVAAPASAPTVMALAQGKHLVAPTTNVRGIGYHEVNAPNAVPLQPVGTPTENLNPDKAPLPAPASAEPYMVLPTRSRASSGTAAVDIRMDHGDAVHAVVSGTVHKVTDYALYGRYPDQIVDIVPMSRPNLLVRMYHVEGAQVTEGQPVVAGQTVVAASARQLPFESQIDRYAGHGPHVHIEVRDMSQQ